MTSNKINKSSYRIKIIFICKLKKSVSKEKRAVRISLRKSQEIFGASVHSTISLSMFSSRYTALGKSMIKFLELFIKP